MTETTKAPAKRRRARRADKTGKPKAQAGRPAAQDKPGPPRSESETDRKRIVSLFLTDIGPGAIAKRLNLPVATCRRVCKAAASELADLSRDSLRGLVAREFVRLIDGQRLLSGELVQQVIRYQTERDRAQALEDSKEVERLDGLVRQAGKAVTEQNRSFVDWLTRMGVPDTSPPPQKGSHPVGSALPAYSDLPDAEAILEETRLSTERQLAYLRSGKGSDKEVVVSDGDVDRHAAAVAHQKAVDMADDACLNEEVIDNE